MPTDAQNRATERYRRAHLVSVLVRFNRETDADMLAHLEAQANKQGYIKGLIAADMRRSPKGGDVDKRE